MNLITKAALLACTGFALTACGGDGNDLADALNLGSPSARFVNAIPGDEHITLYRNNDLQGDAGSLAYEDSSKYFDTVTTTSTWSVRDATSGTELANTSVRAEDGTRYTILALPGAGTQPNLVQISDPYNVALTSDSARVRMVNAAANDGIVDVYLTAPGADLSTLSPTIPAVTYQGVVPASGSNSTSIGAGTYQIRMTVAGTKTVFFTGTINIGDNDDLLLLTLPGETAALGDVKILDIPAGASQPNAEILNG